MLKLWREQRSLFLATLLASCLISIWRLYMDDVINNDGIEYLRAANAFSQGLWQAGFEIYRWPLYPGLIALISVLGDLGLETAAHLLNILLWSWAVLAFLALVLAVGGDRLTLIMAAIMLLLYPGFNATRAFIIRDPGYIAAYLMALLALFEYWENSRRTALLRWAAWTLLSTLFRVEGAVFLVLTPFFILWWKLQSRPSRWWVVLIVLGIALVFAAAMGWWLYIPTPGYPKLDILQQPLAAISSAWLQIAEDLSDKLLILKADILGVYSAKYGSSVLLFAILLILFAKTVAKIGFIHALIIGYAVKRHWWFPRQDLRQPWLCYVLINLLILTTFVVVKLFLAQRYSLALALSFLLLLPFALARLFRLWRSGRKNALASGKKLAWFVPTLFVLLILIGVRNLAGFTSKSNIKQAGLWLQAHSTAYDHVLSNNKIFNYYTGKPGTLLSLDTNWQQFITRILSSEWQQYEYIVVRLTREQRYRLPRLQRLLQREPIKLFPGRHDSLVAIFRTSGR